MIAPDGAVLVTTQPVAGYDRFQQLLLDMVREVFGGVASWRHSKEENDRLRAMNFRQLEQPETYRAQLDYLRRRLTAEPAFQVFFVLDPDTGAPRFVAPIVASESMNGPGAAPLVTPAGRVIVKYQALLRSRYEHYSPLLNVVGLCLDCLSGDARSAGAPTDGAGCAAAKRGRVATGSGKALGLGYARHTAFEEFARGTGDAVRELIGQRWRPLVLPAGKAPDECYRVFNDPSETLYTLLLARPFLDSQLQSQADARLAALVQSGLRRTYEPDAGESRVPYIVPLPVDHHRPGWWLAWNVEQLMRNETPFQLPSTPLEIFAARALLLREPAARLQGFVDLPWCHGDEFYIQKLALTLHQLAP